VRPLRIVDDARKKEFVNRGYKSRYFFPHETYYLPRCGPEGFFFANRMWHINDPNFLWETILYAWGDSIEEFPEELFFDRDIMWHQEHFGKRGQIATANLIIDGDKLYTLDHVSDLVQRIHIRNEYKTRINSCFRHWHHMLLNSILNFAVEKSLAVIYSPSADLLMDKFYNGRVKPRVDRRYFDRIYDRDVNMHFDVDQKDGMWIIDVRKNRHKLVVPEKRETSAGDEKKTICVLHDIESGRGSAGVDPVLAESGDKDASKTLEGILRIEKRANVKATYSVVGAFLNEVKASITQDGHCLAFHSYDHQISRQPVTNYMRDEVAALPLLSSIGYKVTYCVNVVRKLISLKPVGYQPIAIVYRKALNKVRRKLALRPVINQFAACRSADWRIKGYRHYQPGNASDVSDKDLCYYNFEWIAIDEEAPMAEPALQNRVVRIPVFCDDSEMHNPNEAFEAWEERVIERIKQSKFTAIGVHDCYGKYWLPHYAAFLDKIESMGQLKTLDEVADQVFLANAT